MKKGPTAPFTADVLGAKIREVGTLASSHRLSVVVLLGCMLASASRSQPWVWSSLLLFLVLVQRLRALVHAPQGEAELVELRKTVSALRSGDTSGGFSLATALQLTVRDDAGQRLGAPAPAFMPRSLTERAQELGGTLQRRLHNGLDTELCITLPS